MGNIKSPYTLYMQGHRVSWVMRECNLSRENVIKLFTGWDTSRHESKPTFKPDE